MGPTLKDIYGCKKKRSFFSKIASQKSFIKIYLWLNGSSNSFDESSLIFYDIFWPQNLKNIVTFFIIFARKIFTFLTLKVNLSDKSSGEDSKVMLSGKDVEFFA